MASTPDYTILAAPRISAATFASILRGASSPAAAEAAAQYQAFVAAGVDPTVGLAVFRKESTFGRFGYARKNRSWGNIRGAPSYNGGGFRTYSSWTAGAADCARLLAVYGRNQIRPGTDTSTVQRFPYVWAPSSDGNAPDRYGDLLAQWIQEWSGQNGTVIDATLASSSTDCGPGLAAWQAHLASVGIPNDPDHVFTHDEAIKIVDVLYPSVLGYPVPDHDNAVKFFEGKTVCKTASGGSTSPIPDPLSGLASVADAIAGIPGAFGEVLVQLALVLAILGLLAMGVWLVATSND